MEPAVPFAALGAAALLAVAAWAALAAAAVALRGLRTPTLLVAAGALLLAGVEVATAVDFGSERSDTLALLRGTGGLLLTGGLALGALGVRLAVPAAPAVPGVVVPLAAAPAPSVLAGGALLAATLMALRTRRDPAAALLAAGLLGGALAALLGPLADDGPRAALAVVLLRGAGALLVLGGLVVLAQSSLLAKVVATTLAGVLAMSIAALAVVGTVVVRTSEDQAAELVTQTARDRVQALTELAPPLQLLSRALERTCPRPSAACAQALREVGPERPGFAVRVPRTGTPVVTAQEGFAPTPAEVLALRQQPPVQALLDGVATGPQSGLVRLAATGRLAAVGVAPAPRDSPDVPLASVLVYGVPLDDAVLQTGLTPAASGVALLAGEPLQVVASEGDAGRDAAALERARTLAADGALRPEGATLLAAGSQPTLRLQPVPDGEGRLLGFLAVTRDARATLAAQREALTALLLSAVVTTALVALLALLLGRRTVEPVRRLTAAARRLAAGDLSAAGEASRSRDEVGVLGRTFATMTGALAGLTGDLRSSAARLETVLASMSDGLLSADGSGTVTAANRAAAELLGRDDLVGRPLSEVADVRGADGAALADPTLRVADAAGEVHRADGTRVPVRVTVSDLRDGGEGVVVVLRDTTRETEVERMKTEFLSNVSHELRTPLTPIRGYAEILVNRPGLDGDKVGRFAGTILSEALKMNRVVDLLVDVASIEAGRVVPRPQEVDVRALLDSRVEAWRAKAPERADDLRRRAAAGLPAVLVDVEWSAKALDELLDNAVKFTQPGTAITLVAGPAPDGHRVRVSVRDAGPGIAERDRALLFTSFEQVDGSATRRVGGLGLGLSFVRRVAEDFGLPLTVSSTVGKGSEFSLDLPAVAALPRPRARAGTSAARTSATPRSRAARR